MQIASILAGKQIVLSQRSPYLSIQPNEIQKFITNTVN